MHGRVMQSMSMWAAITAMAGATPAAQPKPSLSGTWTLDAEKSAARAPAAGRGIGAGGGSRGTFSASGGMRAGSGTPEWTIQQTASTLTITHPLPDGSTQTFVYKLDGSESVNVNGRFTLTSKTVVSGGRITTTGTQLVKSDQGDATAAVREVRWLDADGTQVVETTRTIGANPPTMSTVVLVKRP